MIKKIPKDLSPYTVQAYKLVPIAHGKTYNDRIWKAAKYTGIGQKYGTAVIDWRKRKILYTHI
jgi:hypothetical protein